MWDGAFMPFRKHHLGTGDLANHIIILDYEPESPEFQDDDPNSLVYEVTVQFVGSDDTFVFEVQGPLDAVESDMMEGVLEQVSPE